MLILTFILATLQAEIGGKAASAVSVKRAIVWTMPFLVALLIVAGLCGRRLARRPLGGLALRKSRRMRLAALNGLIILIPSALFLAARAESGNFDTAFYGVQGLELLTGLTNLTLLLANARDGLAMRPTLS